LSGEKMSRSKKRIQSFTIFPEEGRVQAKLDILSILKNEKDISSERISNITGLRPQIVSEYMNSCTDKNLLEISSSAERLIQRKKDTIFFLGVGFGADKCFTTLVNAAGDIVDSEQIDIEPLSEFKGKKKEIVELLNEIKGYTKFRTQHIALCGVGVPENIIRANEKKSFLLLEGIARLFNSDVYFCKNVMASGYGEKEIADPGTKDVLYLYSDVGVGVILKGETIYQSDSKIRDKNSSYLRSWEQFGIVNIAKDLVNKGVGSNIVEMVNGDIESIDLGTVLKAAEENDELAIDLMTRSALALGVRAAYLTNVFDTRVIILGGGTEKGKGYFKDFVKESADKFLKKELEGKIQILNSKLGEQASSFGAANLCVRELFLEV
jgi:predicted NBD/HSP70 family sugar kinase